MFHATRILRKHSVGAARAAGYLLRACRRRSRGGKPRFLLVAWYDPWGVWAVREHVESILRYSRHRFDLLNLHGLSPIGGIHLPWYVSLKPYDGVLLHCTVSWNPDTLHDLDRRHRQKLAEYRGLKVLIKQDEHFRVHRTLEYIERTGIDLLLTCLSPQEVGKVYPAARFPRLRLLHTLTGYVSERLRSLKHSQQDPRPIDVGYRGSAQPFSFGRLCYEKREIGDRWVNICAQQGLRADISWRNEDRLGGRAWLRFLARCKATLAVESGGSIFDFTGELEQQCAAYLRRHPRAEFPEVHRRLLARHEGNVRYGQVAPRHFEAAACRTLQIMYEGEYSGVFRPWEHYLPLRRDLGNLDEVLARFRDPAERLRITERAFREVILDEAYSHATFARRLDEALDAGR